MVTKKPAVKAWQERALVLRGTLRERGVRGPLRNIDMVVQGQRGAAVARGVELMLHNLRAAGLTVDEIREAMREAMDAMVDAVIDGPHAA